MHEPPRLESAALETMFETVLAEHPDAFVTAIEPSPNGFFVPIPDSIHVPGRFVLQGRTALDLVVPADRPAIITAWEQARGRGYAWAPSVHLASQPDATVAFHLVDLRVRHGVYMGVLASDAAHVDDIARPIDRALIAPRIGRVTKNELATVMDVDATTTRILGWTAEQMIGHRSLEFIHPDDQERAIRNWMRIIEAPDALSSVRLRHSRADGGWTWLEITNHNYLSDPDRPRVVADMLDISDEMAAQDALRAREQLLRRLAEALPLGVLQATEDGRVIYTNERLHRILGKRLAVTLEEQFAAVSPVDVAAVTAAFQAVLSSGKDDDLEVSVGRGGGAARRCLLRLRALVDDGGLGSGAVITVEDVTESAQLRVELERRATHDLLTAALNRSSIMAVLERALAAETRDTAVIFVDLDRFKAVNDRLGHAAGDELLRIVAQRMSASLRPGDAVGRIGGDEFLVVHAGARGPDAALAIATRIAAALRGTVELSGASVQLQASVGVAHVHDGATDADELVRRADAAMYESKRGGKGAVVTYARPLQRPTRSVGSAEQVA